MQTSGKDQFAHNCSVTFAWQAQPSPCTASTWNIEAQSTDDVIFVFGVRVRWHPTRPAPSAEAVAAATAAAVGVQAEGFSEAMLPELDTVRLGTLFHVYENSAPVVNVYHAG